jgi:peptidoglycan/LPS O-acetylase OafA/YrhL
MLLTAQIEFGHPDEATPSADRHAKDVGASGHRYPEIDVLKALCVLGVVLQHSLRVGWDPGITATEIWLWNMTRFAVPGFFLASGFLYATASAVVAGTTARRLRRILAPYLVASLAAELWKVTRGTNISASSVLLELVSGNALGIYYYVFVLFWLVLFTPLFARLPRSGLPAVVAVLVLAQFLQRSGWITMGPMWSWRSPLVWWVYFFLGWWIRMNEDAFRRWIVRRRAPATIVSAVAVLLCAIIMAFTAAFHMAIMTTGAYAVLGFILAAFWGRREAWRSARVLSEASYPIYLFHVFFILAVGPLIGPDANLVTRLTVLCAVGIAGPLVLTALAQKAFGRYSRDLVGH